MFDRPLTDGRARLAAWCDSLFVDHGVFRLVWSNAATVVPGKVYRANHPAPFRLARLARRYGARSLVNLRGHRRCGSDALSRDAASRLGLLHVDMAFESRGAPHPLPVLMHCKSGADRAGLASGLAVLFEGGTAAEALRQLSWRYGHVRRSRTGILDAFFLRYRAEAEGRLPFLDWVRDEYDEAALKHDFVAGRLSSFVTDQVLRRE